jgi:DNA polymerase-1|tara:strand:- start:192 stop:947 length:756 start_codon:yes stop_codon:yes gene_type:complete
MKLLIDCDYIVYKCCAAAETEMDFGDDVIVVTSNFSDAMKCVRRDLEKIKTEFGSFFDEDLVLFFTSPNNFRKKILPEYKGHRQRKKPCGFKRVIQELKKNYKVILKDTLEADDALGIYATKYPGNVIVSPDKDMRQIPGKLYDFNETVTITEEEGAKWHLIQTMAGDNTDGYSGVPGIGVKKAEKIFEEKGYTWQAVVETFVEKELTEEDALVNARLARILQTSDYDHTNKEPILWTPPSDYTIRTQQDS